jgi:hypothetical protein
MVVVLGIGGSEALPMQEGNWQRWFLRKGIHIGEYAILGLLFYKSLAMNYPAASYGVSSSVLARHSVLDTPAPYLIRGNPVGPAGYRLPPV